MTMTNHNKPIPASAHIANQVALIAAITDPLPWSDSLHSLDYR